MSVVRRPCTPSVWWEMGVSGDHKVDGATSYSAAYRNYCLHVEGLPSYISNDARAFVAATPTHRCSSGLQ